MTMHVVEGHLLTASQVYGIWRLRDLVFAVEQRCDAPDPDGLDLLPSTTHVWTADATGVLSYLRAYPGADGLRHIGRVCTRRDARGTGLSSRLLRTAHDLWPGEEIAIGAQAYLEQWYARHGYVTCGDHYDDAGIDHVPMRRPATA